MNVLVVALSKSLARELGKTFLIGAAYQAGAEIASRVVGKAVKALGGSEESCGGQGVDLCDLGLDLGGAAAPAPSPAPVSVVVNVNSYNEDVRNEQSGGQNISGIAESELPLENCCDGEGCQECA